jgi:N-acetylmuramic acid 6-phosphate (MurNAc-6-P) etherase
VRRSEDILLRLTGRSHEDVCAALGSANGNVKLAVLLLHGCDTDQAAETLDRAGGHLRTALSLLNPSGATA